MGKHEMTMQAKHDVERRFHDAKATSAVASEHRNFYTAGGVDVVWRAYLAAIGDLQGKKVLDFGCGEGWSTLQYAMRGAIVHSFDISPESVRKLMRELETAGVSARLHPAVMAAESLGYAANTFDLILGVSILHHTDLESVGPEVRRVLKPGGRALFIEPLAHNCLLRAFRRLTPQRRTPTEQPMTVEQITAFGRFFGWARFAGYALWSVLPQGLLWATGSRWAFRWSLRLTEAADRWILKTFPFLQRYCWSAIIEVRK